VPALAVVGAQWGDEGKGKIVDFLAPEHDWVVRYQGGANAGHTIVVGGRKSVLHLIPSGILAPRVRCAIASGVVVDPIELLDEVRFLESLGVTARERLSIAPECHVVLPHHKALDRAAEAARGADPIGTTGRGIGPAYEERAARRGVRLGEVADAARFAERARAAHAAANRVLAGALGAPPLPEAEIEPALDAARQLAPFVADVGALAREALDRGERVLLEGAQGTLLDLDHGTYPFVTSSSTTAAGAAVSLGIAPWAVRRVLAVFKAYATRVGGGPFPSEIAGEEADRLVAAGGEFGATTGRRRRVGWFDAVAARFAARVNGATGIALTKIDVLDAWDRVLVCVAYEAAGRRVEAFPRDARELAACRPVLEEWPGWRAPTRGARRLADLPARARAFAERIAALAGAPLEILSVGGDREETFRVA
jgi:adenylosuccinate synthase